MQQPVPVMPTNVQMTNSYQGLDRGLFLIHSAGTTRWGRVHAARTVTLGPASSVGILEYQVMTYADLPDTPEAYLAGTLMTAPDGSQWFDCLTRGMSYTPIVAEYWATESYLGWYVEKSGQKLTDSEKTLANQQAQTFTEASGGWAGLTSMQFVVAFATVLGSPLACISMVLSIEFTKNNQNMTLDIDQFPAGAFDPIRVALSAIRNAS